ncbi:MAG: hypothetical protein BAJATHORv1_20241 [Candidatus Thorarchaeota archaeon]|nr:MAG: hypothetical protein BAJATHORv1_20241 [Candidatus Thorarchaeota archaeon]
MASITLDFPDPLGPTTQVKPGLILIVTVSRPNDLKPLTTNFSIWTKTNSLPVFLCQTNMACLLSYITWKIQGSITVGNTSVLLMTDADIPLGITVIIYYS